ncbi:MAG: KpsF/GutQ family sugar-phosphate isomerase [Pseudomonadota bacterium]
MSATLQRAAPTAEIAAFCRAQEQAIAALRESLCADGAPALTRALDLLGAVTRSPAGRVVVSGVGKSGIIARKIAATLASTGTPAHFVHAGEASHGDLGMVTPDDALLLLSNSGETAELSDLISHARRFGIALIAITASATSTLGLAADAALIYPKRPEACPLALAPTTSTLQQLVMGDLLAVMLMEAQGFSAEDFGALHPGGKLGAQLLRVDTIMHTGASLPLVAPSAPMSAALIEMSQKSFGCVGVLEGERLIGIITDGDLRRHMSDGLLAAEAATVMTPTPAVITAGTLAVEALREMNTRAITSLFVVADGRPVGIVHVHDLLRRGVR